MLEQSWADAMDAHDARRKSARRALLRKKRRQNKRAAKKLASARATECQHPAGSFKTAPCRNWSALGRCRYGPRCQFAHGPAELRPWSSPAPAPAPAPAPVRTAAPRRWIPSLARRETDKESAGTGTPVPGSAR